MCPLTIARFVGINENSQLWLFRIAETYLEQGEDSVWFSLSNVLDKDANFQILKPNTTWISSIFDSTSELRIRPPTSQTWLQRPRRDLMVVPKHLYVP